MERRKIVRKPVEEEEEQPGEEEMEDAVDADQDLEDDDEPEPVKPAKRTAVVTPPPAKAKVTLKKVTVADEDDEPEPVKKVTVPAPTKKAAPVAAKKVAAEDDGQEEVVEDAPKAAAKTFNVKTVSTQVMEDLLNSVLTTLDDGKSIVITCVSENKWTIASGAAALPAAASKAGRLVGRAYEEEVFSPEYIAWNEEWSQLTSAEKAQRAKKLKVTFEGMDDPNVDERVKGIRLTQAVREAMGIEKYKPEYATQKARNAIRG